MSEIIEKGLLIGFGLSLLLVTFSFIQPYLSMITNSNINNFDYKYNKLVFIMDNACKYTPNIDNETSKHDFTIQDEIRIESTLISRNTCIIISSSLKNTTIFTERKIVIENSRLFGNFSLIFFYYFTYTEMKVLYL